MALRVIKVLIPETVVIAALVPKYIPTYPAAHMGLFVPPTLGEIKKGVRDG